VDTIGFNPSVTLGGPLVSHPQPVMTYTINTTASVYLRVADDVQFLNGSWFPQSGTASSNGTTWSEVPFPGGLLPRDLNVADGGIGKDEQPVTATLTMQPNATGSTPLVPFAGDPASVNRPGVAFGSVSGPASSDLLTVDEVQLERPIVVGTTVVTSAYTSTATAAQLRAAGINYPSWTNQYTVMQDDVGLNVEAIRNVARQWTAGGPTDPYDEALEIQQQLRDPTHFQYTLNPPQEPSSDVWPVVYFLTISHKGYCQYFASAMGSLLRSLGIPTRLVSGYGPGESQSLNGRSLQNQKEVTTSDAHSWVEAYFPTYGWIPFEPTPPSTQGNYQPFPRGADAVVTPTPPPVATPRTGPTIKPGNVGGSDPSNLRTPKAHPSIPAAVVISLSVLAGAIVLAVAALLWMLLPRSLSGAWRRVETIGVIVGVDRRNAETHRAFAARLARARPRAGPALGELATVTARAEFSEAGASGPERAQALRTWRRALFAATLRPGKSPG
jgi:hypothetical protein